MKKPDRYERLLDMHQMDADDIRACSIPVTRVLKLLRGETARVRRMVRTKRNKLYAQLGDRDLAPCIEACDDILAALKARAK